VESQLRTFLFARHDDGGVFGLGRIISADASVFRFISISIST
jgi:hypothetical protein